MSTLRIVLKAAAMGLKTFARELENMEKVLDKLETQAEKGATRHATSPARPSTREGVRKRKKGTSTDAVLTIVEKRRKGVGTALLKQKTGFSERKIWSIVNSLKKRGKIKAGGRGIYVKA